MKLTKLRGSARKLARLPEQVTVEHAISLTTKRVDNSSGDAKERRGRYRSHDEESVSQG
jgi:hypothetical protein